MVVAHLGGPLALQASMVHYAQMKKAIHKSQGGARPGAGRPATGKDPVLAMRFPMSLRAAVVKWAEKQHGLPTISDAIRQLVEIGLTAKRSHGKRSTSQRARAKELAGQTIDRLSDAEAHEEDKASRKRRLLKGPTEFQEARAKRAKAKS